MYSMQAFCQKYIEFDRRHIKVCVQKAVTKKIWCLLPKHTKPKPNLEWMIIARNGLSFFGFEFDVRISAKRSFYLSPHFSQQKVSEYEGLQFEI